MHSIISSAGIKCNEYRETGFHCAESIIRACADALNIKIPGDVLKAVCGFSGGGGGMLESCGLLEAGIALISYLHGRISVIESEEKCYFLIRIYHERFRNELGSYNCRDLQSLNNMECAPIFIKAAEILTCLLLEADKLAGNLSSAKNK